MVEAFRSVRFGSYSNPLSLLKVVDYLTLITICECLCVSLSLCVGACTVHTTDRAKGRENKMPGSAWLIYRLGRALSSNTKTGTSLGAFSSLLEVWVCLPAFSFFPSSSLSFSSFPSSLRPFNYTHAAQLIHYVQHFVEFCYALCALSLFCSHNVNYLVHKNQRPANFIFFLKRKKFLLTAPLGNFLFLIYSEFFT